MLNCKTPRWFPQSDLYRVVGGQRADLDRSFRRDPRPLTLGGNDANRAQLAHPQVQVLPVNEIRPDLFRLGVDQDVDGDNQRGRSALGRGVEGRADLLMRTPTAKTRWPGPPVAGCVSPLDCPRHRLKLALKA